MLWPHDNCQWRYSAVSTCFPFDVNMWLRSFWSHLFTFSIFFWATCSFWIHCCWKHCSYALRFRESNSLLHLKSQNGLPINIDILSIPNCRNIVFRQYTNSNKLCSFFVLTIYKLPQYLIIYNVIWYWLRLYATIGNVK